jgi:hypothetical protein
MVQKQKENAENFYLGSRITNDARDAREIKSRIPMEKAAVHRNKTVLINKMKVKFKEKTSKTLHLKRCAETWARR